MAKLRMKYPKLRELREAVKALIKGPYTSSFPYKPHKPFERFRGKPQYHEDDCVGCGACFQVCPAGAIEMQDLQGERVLTINWDVCIACGQCQANCITEKGIILSNDFDLSTTESRKELKQQIRKKLLICSCCKEPIAPYEHLLWVAGKLGSLVFSNASLMLFYLENLNKLMEKKQDLKQEGEPHRADRIKVLCPRCRREAVIKS